MTETNPVPPTPIGQWRTVGGEWRMPQFQHLFVDPDHPESTPKKKKAAKKLAALLIL